MMIKKNKTNQGMIKTKDVTLYAMDQTLTDFGLQPPSDMSFNLSASVTDGREMSLDSGIFHILQQQQQWWWGYWNGQIKKIQLKKKEVTDRWRTFRRRSFLNRATTSIYETRSF